MSAKAIREVDGKRLLARALANASNGALQVDTRLAALKDGGASLQLQAATPEGAWLKDTKLVIKPDQLIKRRGKRGLVGLNLDLEGAAAWAAERAGKEIEVDGAVGTLDTFIVEPFLPHEASDEYYVAIVCTRAGDEVLFYHEGGVDVGDVDAKAERVLVPVNETLSEADAAAKLLQHVPDERRALLATFVATLYRVFVDLHFTYLEINPICVVGNTVVPLDLAARLDQTATYLVGNEWGASLSFPPPFGRKLTPEEAYIAELDAKTGASLKLTVLNPHGRIWLMVAGGGASVVYTDTVADLGYSGEIANYGEYSGAPSETMTYEYAKTILKLLTSGHKSEGGKILLIGGGIANFTNVAATFKGIVRAIIEFRERLLDFGTRIFVRRGGPNYKEGLVALQNQVAGAGLHIEVYGPETHMTAIVPHALGLPQSDGVMLRDGTLPYRGEADYTQDVLSGAAGAKRGFGPPRAEPAAGNELFTAATQSIVWGMQPRAVQSMLDFDHMCGRKQPSVSAIIYPFATAYYRKFFWGATEIMLPVVPSVEEALRRFPNVDTMVNFASFRSAYEATCEALAVPAIRTIAVIAEGVPERKTRALIADAAAKGVTIIGPATVGGIKPGAFRIGNTGGMLDNVMASKLYRPGSVCYVSRSGGMSNELNNIISRNANGVYEGVAIGGDRYPGTSFLEHLVRFQNEPNAKMLVLLGEVGGIEEYEVARAIEDGTITKPIVAWCIGTCADAFTTEVQFGHAGANAHSNRETAAAKNAALAAVGAHVPASFNDLGRKIREVFATLLEGGTITEEAEPEPPKIPIDYGWAQKLGLVRKPASFVSTISDDRGEELMYAGMPISRVFSEDIGIGGVLSLLWFRRRLPPYACKFMEMVLMLTADHGPAVCGAHNTIVTARAGKDLISSLVAGLVTIGPRFGGAVDGAAALFSDAADRGLTPSDFVAEMRRKKKLIMGIGHRIKSVHNPDKRVTILKQFAFEHFPATPVLQYALEVEKVTTKKKDSLILNVDGTIGCAFVDLLRGCGAFTIVEANDFIKRGFLNGLFVLGRSIGFIGHFLDQKRLQEGLYRHPWEDITYLTPPPMEGDDRAESVADAMMRPQ